MLLDKTAYISEENYEIAVLLSKYYGKPIDFFEPVPEAIQELQRQLKYLSSKSARK